MNALVIILCAYSYLYSCLIDKVWIYSCQLLHTCTLRTLYVTGIDVVDVTALRSFFHILKAMLCQHNHSRLSSPLFASFLGNLHFPSPRGCLPEIIHNLHFPCLTLYLRGNEAVLFGDAYNKLISAFVSSSLDQWTTLRLSFFGSSRFYHLSNMHILSGFTRPKFSSVPLLVRDLTAGLQSQIIRFAV